jgi:type II secretory pathway pseudopilin PulG
MKQQEDRMHRKLPWAEIIVTAVAIGLGAIVYLYAHKDEGALEESKERGAVLVAALDSYRQEHGTYPAALDDLVPEFIAVVEPPTWGLARWRYRRYTPDDVAAPAAAPASDTSDAAGTVFFQLSVAADESGYPVLYYDLPAQRWVLNN